MHNIKMNPNGIWAVNPNGIGVVNYNGIGVVNPNGILDVNPNSNLTIHKNPFGYSDMLIENQSGKLTIKNSNLNIELEKQLNKIEELNNEVEKLKDILISEMIEEKIRIEFYNLEVINIPVGLLEKSSFLKNLYECSDGQLIVIPVSFSKEEIKNLLKFLFTRNKNLENEDIVKYMGY